MVEKQGLTGLLKSSSQDKVELNLGLKIPGKKTT